MVVVITKTVGATGRDFATVTLAEASLHTGAGGILSNLDMTAAGGDETVVFELHEDGTPGGVTFDEGVTISAGLTTDETHQITIQVATADRHDGTRLSGVRSSPVTAGGHAFTVSEDFTRFSGLELLTGAANSDECFRITTGVVGVQVLGCILEAGNAGASTDGMYAGNYGVGSLAAPINATNCLFLGFQRAGIHAQIFSGGGTLSQWWDVVNCTFAMCGYSIGHRTSSGAQVVTMRIINCISGNSGSKDFGTTASSSGTIVTTGSTTNRGERTGAAAAFPANLQSTFTDNTAPAAGEWVITVDWTGATFDLANALLVDDLDNDAQAWGVTNGDNGLVPSIDAMGNTRPTAVGANVDVGFHEVTPGAGSDTNVTQVAVATLPLVTFAATVDAATDVVQVAVAALPFVTFQATIDVSNDVLVAQVAPATLPLVTFATSVAVNVVVEQTAPAALPFVTFAATVIGSLNVHQTAPATLPFVTFQASVVSGAPTGVTTLVYGIPDEPFRLPGGLPAETLTQGLPVETIAHGLAATTLTYDPLDVPQSLPTGIE